MNPNRLQSQLQAAISHHLAGRLEQADVCYAAVLQLAPRNYQALHLKGALAYQRTQHDDAARLLTKALAVQPRAAATLMCLGLAQAALGRTAEAEANLRAAVRQEPKNVEAWNNLAAFLLKANRPSEAIECRRAVVRLAPESADALTALGATLVGAGQVNEGISCHLQALTRSPRHPMAHFHLACAYQNCQRVAEALREFEAHLAIQPDHLEAQSGCLFLRNYDPALTREQHFADHLSYGQAVANAAARTPVRAGRPEPGRTVRDRVRVAFLSPDLRTHAVAVFLEPLLRHLDKGTFEIVLYHDHFVVDATSERLKAHAVLWRNFCGRANEEVEDAIRADAPDILFDLAGHTGSRLPLFALRLAPVQISYLGYPNTTGVAAIDYRFTDALADPEGETDRFHTESLIRFAPTAWAYQPPAGSPEPAKLPCTQGRPVTFGSFNAFGKVNGATLRLWAEVLDAVPGSRLVLKSAGLDPAVARAHLAAAGLDTGRFEVLPPCVEYRAHLESYANIDITLDPFPYNGTTTTCEAFWMGRPVITLAGDHHAGRVGVSLLSAIDRRHWIAETAADYVRIARELSGDVARLSAESAGLRDAMLRSPLLDHVGQASRFGKALHAVWQARSARGTAAA